MDVSRKRAGVKTSVVAGSVWETRMKVFNGDGVLDDQIPDSPKKIAVKKNPIGAGNGVSSKRKTWKSQSLDGNIQIAKKFEEQSVSSTDGIKKSSTTRGRRGGRSDEKISIQVKKGRSDSAIEKKNPIQIPKSRSDVKLDSVDSSNLSGNKDIEIDKSDPDGGIEKNPPEIEDNGSEEESCKEFGVCEEQIISANEEEGEEVEEEEEEEQEIAIEVEKKSVVDIVEIKLAAEEEKKVETKSSSVEDNKPKKVEISQPQHKAINKKEEKNVYHHQFRNRTAVPTSSTFKHSPPPVIRRAQIYQSLSKPTSSVPLKNEYQNFQERHNKLQNLVDLVMWRDISRSAFVFGIGTFIIISSSYTKDLNVSFISVISYLGLVYLAAIFLYRSLICRGVIDINDKSYVLGEEEAIWLLKLFLPYLNESLLKIKALFSGDPSTTMKMAVLLFVFARCGNSITIWKMAKLGFFGVFIVPKVCSSYSQQLTGYAKFWIRRFRDAWDSCTHKKAVALAIFSLVWNLSSMVARVWAVFMMFVAVRYYQQSMESDDWEEVEAEDEGAGDNDTLQGQDRRQGLGDGPRSTPVEINKVKKGS